jgi:predicted RNase H-like nuclease (RuvC/YqgF family)
LHNQVVFCTTSTLDDDFIENDEFCVVNANNLDDEAEIESFLSSLESPIHDSSSQKEIIEKLENKISEFELKVQSYESKLQNLKKNCQMHLGEVATLKGKVQNLETKNRALKSSYISTNITSMDLDKVIGQSPSNKSSLEYKKYSKILNYPQSKEKQGQGSNVKIVKSTSAKSFTKKHKYTFQYKQFDKKINKGQINFQNNNATFFNPNWSNKLYFKGLD